MTHYEEKLTFDVPQIPAQKWALGSTLEEYMQNTCAASDERQHVLATTPLHITNPQELRLVLEGLQGFLEHCQRDFEEAVRFGGSRAEARKGEFMWLYQEEVTRALAGLLSSPFYRGTATQRLALLAELDQTDRVQFHKGDHVPALVRQVVELLA